MLVLFKNTILFFGIVIASGLQLFGGHVLLTFPFFRWFTTEPFTVQVDVILFGQSLP